jgi:hypothetical protein
MNALWDTNLQGFTAQGTAGNPWSATTPATRSGTSIQRPATPRGRCTARALTDDDVTPGMALHDGTLPDGVTRTHGPRTSFGHVAAKTQPACTSSVRHSATPLGDAPFVADRNERCHSLHPAKHGLETG